MKLDSDMVPFAPSPLANPNSFGQGLARTASTDLVKGVGGRDILRLNKGTGKFEFGVDRVPIEDGSEWAVNPYTLQHGHVSWDEATIVGEHMCSMSQPATPVSELGPPPGKEWQTQLSVQMMCLTGEHKGTTVLYKGTALGLKDFFADLVPMIATRMQDGEDKLVPVIVLGETSYMHKNKQFGKIYKPAFTVLRWVAIDSNPEEDVEPEPEPEQVVQRIRGRGRGRGRKAA